MPVPSFRSIDELPIALTVDEAASVLRIGRTKVYDLVHRWHATDGAEGLRSVSLGRVVRIPRIAVLELLGETLAPPAAEGGRPVAGA